MAEPKKPTKNQRELIAAGRSHRVQRYTVPPRDQWSQTVHGFKCDTCGANHESVTERGTTHAMRSHVNAVMRARAAVDIFNDRREGQE